ncbi:hypothetical protein LCGC14_2612080, partial [marine sediment metagenome]
INTDANNLITTEINKIIGNKDEIISQQKVKANETKTKEVDTLKDHINAQATFLGIKLTPKAKENIVRDLGSGVFVPAPIVELGCTTEIVCAHPWDCDTAMRVVKCETGGTFDPTVVGNDRERGCLQIHPVHWDKPQCDPEFLFDPAYNAACAYSIWEDSGWGPWSCY